MFYFVAPQPPSLLFTHTDAAAGSFSKFQGRISLDEKACSRDL